MRDFCFSLPAIDLLCNVVSCSFIVDIAGCEIWRHCRSRQTAFAAEPVSIKQRVNTDCLEDYRLPRRLPWAAAEDKQAIPQGIELMDNLQAWRKNLQLQIENEFASMEEEHDFWEKAILTGPLSIQGIDSIQKKRKPGGGSVPGKRPNKDRKRERGHQIIWDDYFAEDCTYDNRDFRRRFRMTRRLFHRILAAVSEHDSFFQQKRDAANKIGLSGLQKVTAALRQLALGIGADATDEYCRLGESTARESLYRFCLAIRQLYEEKYLRKPERSDILRLLAVNEARGFPGMFASLDCMHYEWKNCPVAWQGQFTDKDGNKSIVLEAIADQELWIWHAFFGLPGGNNDLNVLDRSPLVNDMLHQQYDQLNYNINGTEYKRAYLLVDGIYPKWSCFVTTFHKPQTLKKCFFAKCQEAARKDVERAFGVLQARWGIVKQPARSWHQDRVHTILMACIVLHNMIIEDERGEVHEDLRLEAGPLLTVSRGSMPWTDYLAATRELENKSSWNALRKDLMEHLWKRKGDIELEQ